MENGINELVPNFAKWDLCSEAEPRLAQAMSDQALIVVNGLMLVKMVGELVGVALHEEDLKGGRSSLQTWYYPQERAKGRAIQRAFIGGEVRVELPGVTTWAMLRKVVTENVCPGQDLPQRIQKLAAQLERNTAMPDGYSRDEYFETYGRHLGFGDI